MEKLHRELSLDSIVTLIELASGLPFDDNAPFEPQLVYEALVAALPHLNKGQHGFEDSWKEVSKRLIEWKVTYAMPLLDKLLDCMGDDYRASYDFAVAPLATELLRQNPAEGWIIITRQLEETLPKWRSDLQNWLKGCHSRMDSDNERLVPIAYVNLRAVLDWIDVDPESRSVLIAHAAPRTLADEIGGVLTRELITLYGHFKGVLNGISAIFGSGGWTGPTSVYLRGRRDIFRSWLAADFSPEVTQWIESEIDDLDRDISRAEIEEERSRFD